MAIIQDAKKKILPRVKWMDRQAIERPLSAVMGCDGEKRISLDRYDSR